jgi:hypothetical protein
MEIRIFWVDLLILEAILAWLSCQKLIGSIDSDSA